MDEAKRQWCLKKLAERKERAKKRTYSKRTGSGGIGSRLRKFLGGITRSRPRTHLRHIRNETDYLVSTLVPGGTPSAATAFRKDIEAGSIFGLDTDPSDRTVQVSATATTAMPSSGESVNTENALPENSPELNEQIRAWREKKLMDMLEKKRKKEAVESRKKEKKEKSKWKKWKGSVNSGDPAITNMTPPTTTTVTTAITTTMETPVASTMPTESVEPSITIDTTPAERAAAEPTATEPTSVEPSAADTIPVEGALTEPGAVEGLPEEAGPAQSVPAETSQAATTQAESIPTDVIPAATTAVAAAAVTAAAAVAAAATITAETTTTAKVPELDSKEWPWLLERTPRGT